MCGFAGFSDYLQGLPGPPNHWLDIARRMARRISHRGPDEQGVHFSSHCALAHARLAVMDPKNGQQPMSLPWQGGEATIAYNGEVHNAPESAAAGRARLFERVQRRGVQRPRIAPGAGGQGLLL